MQMSKLDLRTRDSILRGGERGAAVVPNYPEQSRLYTYAIHKQKPAMPPGKKLPEEDLEVLRRWIAAGAILENTSPEEMDKKAALAKLEERPVSEEERQFWSFQPPVRHPLPKVEDRFWGRNPVDAFLLAAMEEKGLKPSPEAGKRALVRRAYLDVIGLPPSPEQVQAFLDDDSPKAWGGSWMSCSHRPTTASAGRATGSTWCVTPTPAVSSVTSTGRTCGATATMWSIL